MELNHEGIYDYVHHEKHDLRSICEMNCILLCSAEIGETVSVIICY